MLQHAIVFLTADNGAMTFSGPGAGSSPFQGEKTTTWETGVRVPGLFLRLMQVVLARRYGVWRLLLVDNRVA